MPNEMRPLQTVAATTPAYANFGTVSKFRRLFRRRSTQTCVECLHNELQSPFASGSPARHTRFAHPPDASAGTQPRPCDRQTYPANFRGSAADRNRFVVSRTPPAGGERLDRGILGAFGQRQTCTLLSPHGKWAKTTHSRTVEMAGVLARDRIDPRSQGSGGLNVP